MVFDGAAFRTWREKREISQGGAADRFEVTRRTVIRWEKGEAPVPEHVAMECSPEAVKPKNRREHMSAADQSVGADLDAIFEAKEIQEKSGFDPVKAGLKPDVTTNEVFGVGMGKTYDRRILPRGWQRVAGGIRVVNASIPNPINYLPPDWCHWQTVVTADGRLFHQVTGKEIIKPRALRRPDVPFEHMPHPKTGSRLKVVPTLPRQR